VDSCDLTIIIVSWNVEHFLAACLDSIRTNAGSLTLEVIVVDSYSSDGTVEMVRALYPWVKLLPQAANVGFTHGNNIGLAAANSRYMMLLNPDTEVIADALPKMVAYLDDHPDVAIAGPHTLNVDGTTQSTRRRFPTLATAIFESTWLQRFAPKRVLEHYYALDIADDATADVDWVQGSALMIRRKVYGQIGGLDEQYIMFSEETDWCKRARDAGGRVVYLGDAKIVHHGGKSTEQVSALKHIYFQTSKLRYFRKYHGKTAEIALRVFLVMSYTQQLYMEWLKSIVGHKRDMRRERVRIYRQVLDALTGSD
jgi:N-acetylglucosaminyl-diphospho-decaprenol L-rhamnosyltransferase